jgi:hypothetical protein
VTAAAGLLALACGGDGDDDAVVPDASIPADAPAAIDAAPRPTLTAYAIGPGSVTSSPPGIDCPGACEAAFDPGATVTLAQAPAASAAFVGWGGDCTGVGPCTITMDVDRSVTATFEEATGSSWVARRGGPADERSADLAAGPGGALAITGDCDLGCDLGGGALPIAGERDVFVARYTRDGDHVWSHTLGGPLADFGASVVFDAAGGVVVTGRFQGTMTFAGVTVTSLMWSDLFVARYDADGQESWIITIAGIGDEQRDTWLAVDGLGDLFLSGYHRNTISYGGMDLVPIDPGDDNLFVMKLSPADGALVWAHTLDSIGAANRAFPVAIGPDDDVFIVTSVFQSIDVGCGPVFSTWNDDLLVARLDGADGACLWSWALGGLGYDYGFALDADPGSDRIAVGGSFEMTVDFGGGDVTAVGYADGVALQLYAADGAYGYGVTYGDPFPDGINTTEIALADGGDLVVLGAFRGSVDFGAGPVTSVGLADAFLARYGPTGLAWSRLIGGPDLDAVGRSLELDGVGATVAAICFRETLDVDGALLTSEGLSDVALLRLAP